MMENYSTQITALDIVFKSEYLLWNEAIRLGQVHSELNIMWKELEPSYKGWRILLELIESLNKNHLYYGNERYGTFNDIDPRLISDHPYHSASDMEKCKIMAEYGAMLVNNLRIHHSIDKITDFDALPEPFQKRYKDGYTLFTPFDRYTFVINIMALTWARLSMTSSRGPSCDWADTFAGKPYCFEMETSNRENFYMDIEKLCSFCGESDIDKSLDMDPRRKNTDKDTDMYLEPHKLTKFQRCLLGKKLFQDLEILSPFYSFNDGSFILPKTLESDGTLLPV